MANLLLFAAFGIAGLSIATIPAGLTIAIRAYKHEHASHYRRELVDTMTQDEINTMTTHFQQAPHVLDPHLYDTIQAHGYNNTIVHITHNNDSYYYVIFDDHNERMKHENLLTSQVDHLIELMPQSHYINRSQEISFANMMGVMALEAQQMISLIVPIQTVAFSILRAIAGAAAT